MHRIDQPPELNEPGANGGIVDLAEIAGQQLVGHAKPCRHDMQLPPEPFGYPGCRRRLIEADVLAATRIGDEAWFELLDPVAIRIDDRWCDALLAVISAEHDPDDAGFSLLANQLGLRPIVEIAERSHHRRPPWHATGLGSLLLVEMRNVAGRDRQAIEAPPRRDDRIARMLCKEPIGAPLADAVELDALDDSSAIDEVAVAACVQHIGFEQLQLQRHV